VGKKNKARRAVKKSQKTRRLKKLKIQQTLKSITKSSLSSPVFTMLDNPFGHLNDDQRRDLVREIGETNKTKFRESLNTIQSLLKSHDPITLLAIVFGYGLTVGVGDNGVQSKEGQGGLNQSHVEILQALFLQIPRHDWGQNPVTSDVVQRAWEALIELGSAFTFSRMNSGHL
jgi:hypothetical protein